MSKQRTRFPRNSPRHQRARQILGIPPGTVSLYAAYLVIFVRLLALALHNVDLRHLG